MKIDRLIGIITILLGQDKVTAPELAKRFEVSRRTINRDIEDIDYFTPRDPGLSFAQTH